MLRTVAFIGALSVFSGIASAQQPCTTDARRVVDEIYRHMLERSADAASSGWVDKLSNGSATVRDVVRDIAKSPEHMQRFGNDARDQTVGTMYRHLLGRQPDAAGQQAFTNVAATRGLGAVVDEILASSEYQQSFGEYGVPGSGGMRYCGSGQSTNTQSGSVAPDMLFSAMDTNRDGIITRGEWRGTSQSFQVHDWNGDGVLTGDEVRAGARRPAVGLNEQDYNNQYIAWSDAGFQDLDRNRDGRLTANEWIYDAETFRRIDRNGDGAVSRAEFLAPANDDRGDSFNNLDANGNGRIERNEWHGDRDTFEWLDRNHDNVLSRAEAAANTNPAPDQFANLDLNRDGRISLDEWRWSRRSFDQQDLNRDGFVTRREFNGNAVPTSGR